MQTIKIFDTTLRDGEQSPGASMNIEEKIKLAIQLEKLGVDVIEAGFAASSPGDFEAINQIAQRLQKSCVCSLARAIPNDIESAFKAISPAKNKRIHTFIATSPIHMKHKLKMTPEAVLKRADEAIRLAVSLTNDVEFSCEDAFRSDINFLKEMLDLAIKAGATTLNIPDTVGFRVPNEIGAVMGELNAFVKNRAILSIHCHNDLGLASANALEAIKCGARQVECTINGLGERAGNTALEEIVMAIRTRADFFSDFKTNINIKEIYPTSKLVSDITGIIPQPNKAIVGKNAFAHESGIHQDGVLKNRETYEIINPSDIGINLDSALVLGKHSGRAAFKDKAKSLGFILSDDELNAAFDKFKILCDGKKEIFDDDLREILGEQTSNIPKIFSLNMLQVSACSSGKFCAATSIIKDEKEYSDSALGNGAIDCILKSIDRISGIKGSLKDYRVQAVTSGKDALAKVVVKVEFEPNKPALIGHGLDLDTMSATAKAYISALNSYLSMKDLIANKDGTMLL